jgi:hypothetical protein
VPGSKPKNQDYGAILKGFKENPMPPPRPVNKDLLEHDKLRMVEA